MMCLTFSFIYLFCPYGKCRSLVFLWAAYRNPQAIGSHWVSILASSVLGTLQKKSTPVRFSNSSIEIANWANLFSLLSR